MKIFVFACLVFISVSAAANNFTLPLIENFKNGEFSAADIVALIELDNSNERIGYGLCINGGGKSRGVSNVCATSGSVGYGLCVLGGGSASGGSNACAIEGSVGYGFCVIAGGNAGGVSDVCASDGSVGYGLCVLGGGDPDNGPEKCNL